MSNKIKLFNKEFDTLNLYKSIRSGKTTQFREIVNPISGLRLHNFYRADFDKKTALATFFDQNGECTVNIKSLYGSAGDAINLLFIDESDNSKSLSARIKNIRIDRISEMDNDDAKKCGAKTVNDYKLILGKGRDGIIYDPWTWIIDFDVI